MSRKNRTRGGALPPNGKQAKIQSWLMAEGWQIGEVAPNEDMKWGLTASNPSGPILVVFQPIQAPDQTFIQVQMAFDDNFRKQLLDSCVLSVHNVKNGLE